MPPNYTVRLENPKHRRLTAVEQMGDLLHLAAFLDIKANPLVVDASKRRLRHNDTFLGIMRSGFPDQYYTANVNVCQGDRVCEAPYKVERVLGYRWPTDAPLPALEKVA